MTPSIFNFGNVGNVGNAHAELNPALMRNTG